mgnify:CR=1 FL=1
MFISLPFSVPKIILEMLKNNIEVKHAKILILGFTFKEDCPDIRNTKVIEIFNTLTKYKTDIEIVDPLASCSETKSVYKINISNLSKKSKYKFFNI